MYTISFFCALFFSFWNVYLYAFQKKSIFVTLGLILSGGAYVGSLLDAYQCATIGLPLIVLRDVAVLHFSTLILRQVAPLKKFVVIGAVALFSIVGLGYNSILNQSFYAQSDCAAQQVPTQQNNTVESTRQVAREGNFTYDQGEILFDITDPELLKKIKELYKKYKPIIRRAFPDLGSPENTNLDDYYVMDISDEYKGEVAQIIADLSASGTVDWAEPNEIIQLDDPVLADSPTISKRNNYGINDPMLDQLWGFDKMQMETFYGTLQNKGLKAKQVAKIAILDTGIDVEHEDLKDNYVSTSPRFDRDVMGHGTHCAGIAAAVSNNGIGVASFAPNNDFVQITSIKVLSDFGAGSQHSIIKGMIRAADAGAAVISMSLGGSSNQRQQKAYSDAVDYANQKGAIVVVAAGNSNKNAKNYTPANADGVIVVTALDQNLNKAVFSNTIEDLEMGVAAPGVNILSTFPENKYKHLQGTSMATPYVAGLLGIMKAIQPDLTTKQAYEVLHNTGIDSQNTPQTGRFIQPSVVLEVF